MSQQPIPSQLSLLSSPSSLHSFVKMSMLARARTGAIQSRYVQSGSSFRSRARLIASRLDASSIRNASSFNKQASRGLKVVAILYKGGKAAQEEPRLLGTVENEVSFTLSRLKTSYSR